jgi:hypothetical protein
MKWLHTFAHWLNLNDTYRDTIVEAGWVYICKRCTTCNKISDRFPLVELEHFKNFCDIVKEL